jgi:hypothetical protein
MILLPQEISFISGTAFAEGCAISLDIFEQCEPLHCQHERRVFSRRPLAEIELVLQGYYHDRTRR